MEWIYLLVVFFFSLYLISFQVNYCLWITISFICDQTVGIIGFLVLENGLHQMNNEDLLSTWTFSLFYFYFCFLLVERALSQVPILFYFFQFVPWSEKIRYRIVLSLEEFNPLFFLVTLMNIELCWQTIKSII